MSAVPAHPTAPGPARAAPLAPGSLSVPGNALAVSVGQTLAARVLEATPGAVRLAIAGGMLTAATDLPLQPGQTMRMVVSEAGGERVVLTPQPPPGQAQADPAARMAEAMQGAGLSARATTALMAALAQSGVAPDPSSVASFAARAAAGGVSTPAQAAAFVRLTLAGLPATPASVGGVAGLIVDAPIGRALAAIVDAARAAGPHPAAANLAAAAPPGTPAQTTVGVPAQAQTAPPAQGQVQGTAAAATPGSGSGAASAPSSAASTPPAPPAPLPATSPPPGMGAGAPTLGGADVRALGDLLARTLQGIASAGVSGEPEALRSAVAALGSGAHDEAGPAARGRPEEGTVRSLLVALAANGGVDAALGRAAAQLADAVGAQPLAGQTPGPPGTASPSGGSYIQLPLPGGGTAEVRVETEASDSHREGGRTRRVAMLLHLSALGPVMITATAGDGPVDARIRAQNETARSFLADHAGDLSRSLAADGAAARVRVEAVAAPTPQRLLAPPPAVGIDRHA